MRCRRHGEVLEVPPPEERGALVEKAHAQLGHFGGGRTLSLLQNTFWWPGMAREVKVRVGRCLQCDKGGVEWRRSSAACRAYHWWEWGHRWPLDFAEELPSNARGKKCILVIVDHAFKWVEAEATVDKSQPRWRGFS